MKCIKLAGIAMAMALLPAVADAAPVRKHHRSPHVARPALVNAPVDSEGGNAALGGNNANSASGSNSAGENANGRSGGGFGS
ncbi:MAG: hypothetical protein ABWY18_01250 [Tardiphaga sp.]